MDVTELELAYAALAPEEARIEEMRVRHDAFWGPLSGYRKSAARVASDFFAFVRELNYQRMIAGKGKTERERDAAHNRSLELASTALAQFRRFGEVTGTSDDAETGDKLDRFIDYTEQTNWLLAPSWWRKYPQKNTAYFIGQIRIFAGMRDAAVIERRRNAEEGKRGKGGAR